MIYFSVMRHSQSMELPCNPLQQCSGILWTLSPWSVPQCHRVTGACVRFMGTPDSGSSHHTETIYKRVAPHWSHHQLNIIVNHNNIFPHKCYNTMILNFLTAKEQFNKGLCQLVNQRKFFHIVMHL